MHQQREHGQTHPLNLPAYHARRVRVRPGVARSKGPFFLTAPPPQAIPCGALLVMGKKQVKSCICRQGGEAFCFPNFGAKGAQGRASEA